MRNVILLFCVACCTLFGMSCNKKEIALPPKSASSPEGNKKVNDFEDGIEYYAAAGSKCEAIITEDINDFYFSSIAVYSSKAFIEKYLF